MKNLFLILSFLIILIFSFNVDAKEVRPDYEIGFGTVSTSNGVFTMIPFMNFSLHTGISFNVTYIDLNLTMFPYGGSFDLNYAMGVYFDFTKQRTISNILLMEGDFIFYFGEGKSLANDGNDYTSYTLSSGPGLGYKFIERYTRFNIYFTLKAVIHLFSGKNTMVSTMMKGFIQDLSIMQSIRVSGLFSKMNTVSLFRF